MQKIVTLVIFSISSICSISQSLKEYVAKNTSIISSIEPGDNDYSDLDVIGKAIGNATIVMLGEQDHGDAPAFLAKSRLIKYLHEKKGFNVIAFESDFFGLNDGWDNLKKEKQEVEKFIRGNIYPVWSYCNTVADLFYNYIPNTHQSSKPITITGFDNQMHLDFSSKNLVKKIDSLLKHLDLPIVHQSSYPSLIIPTIDSLINVRTAFNRNPEFYARCIKFLKEIKLQAGEKINENNFWMLTLDNLLQFAMEYQLYHTDKKASNNIRDFQMAQNLKWLSEVKYPEEKIIVWAANAHIAKYADSSGKAHQTAYIRMGSIFSKIDFYNKETYILGFTSSSGTAGRLGHKSFKIREPKPFGFENWIDENARYAFVDFKKFNNTFTEYSRPFYLKGLGHQTFFKHDWTKVFDGIFYIKEMYICQ